MITAKKKDWLLLKECKNSLEYNIFLTDLKDKSGSYTLNIGDSHNRDPYKIDGLDPDSGYSPYLRNIFLSHFCKVFAKL